MRTPCLALLLVASTACAAVPNPDRRAWSEDGPPLPALQEGQETAAATGETLALPDPAPAAPPPATPAPAQPAQAPAEAPKSKSPQASRIWVYLGGRTLDSDYEPVEQQGVIGLEYSYEGSDWLVGWEAGLMGSYNEDTLGTVGVGELYGGVRKTFRRYARFQPYLGAGLSLATVRVDPLIGGDQQESSLGGYAHGGFAVLLGKSFHLGLDLRSLFGTDITVFGSDTNVDYVQGALVLGWLL